MKKSDLLQMVKFATVGFLNTVLDYVLFYLFMAFAGLDKNIAQVLATGLAMVNSYLANRYWTFNQSGFIQGREIWRFIVVNVASLLTTLLCLNLFYDVFKLHEPVNRLLGYLKIPFVFTGDHGVMICKLLAMPFSWAVNFLGNRLWVFNNKTEMSKKGKGQ